MRLGRNKLAGAVAAAAGLFFVLATAPQAQAYGYYGTTTIRNGNSGLCLEVADWSTANGAPVRQWPCTGGANQQWDYNYVYVGAYIDGAQLINRNSGKCLEIADWRTDNGAPARQWDCSGGANQTWQMSDSGITEPPKVIWNRHSGDCLEIADWRKDWGAPARQWDCSGGANQKWHYYYD
ncbi:RICIN domain-containing protein [Streptomyces sp. NBC_01565]|uniref:RICIN domain-containing protein n=1 Tax=unclassified Streptomyces TaxID=2593676 RepID=UPI002250F5BD|nr:RICIN domain-containing protein [Streptomyces sp. NBC_01565]MCX4539124.1 RICIN domain-containing protein [Streptomyces sp. NBC_01565]